MFDFSHVNWSFIDLLSGVCSSVLPMFCFYEAACLFIITLWMVFLCSKNKSFVIYMNCNIFFQSVSCLFLFVKDSLMNKSFTFR